MLSWFVYHYFQSNYMYQSLQSLHSRVRNYEFVLSYWWYIDFSELVLRRFMCMRVYVKIVTSQFNKIEWIIWNGNIFLFLFHTAVGNKNRTSNSAPTPVKDNGRPTNHDRSSKTGQSSSSLPRLPTETHGIPTLKQIRKLPAESSKKWATSWAEVRASSLKRDYIRYVHR